MEFAHALVCQLAYLILPILITISTAISGRTLDRNPSASPNADEMITFFMSDVLQNCDTAVGTIAESNGHQPPPKPKSFLPPIERVPSHNPTNMGPAESSPSWLPFHWWLQALEPGMVTTIDEMALGPQLKGRVQGIYVTTSSGNNSCSMVAMKVTFSNGESEDTLRFFGLHQPNLEEESHIAVIGGTGRYQDANGFAVIKAADPTAGPARDGTSKILSVTVYLK